jgi:hypothetical protein
MALNACSRLPAGLTVSSTVPAVARQLGGCGGRQIASAAAAALRQAPVRVLCLDLRSVAWWSSQVVAANSTLVLGARAWQA